MPAFRQRKSERERPELGHRSYEATDLHAVRRDAKNQPDGIKRLLIDVSRAAQIP